MKLSKEKKARAKYLLGKMKECTAESDKYMKSWRYKLNPFGFFKLMSIDTKWSEYESELHKICFGY